MFFGTFVIDTFATTNTTTFFFSIELLAQVTFLIEG